jgi:hypothetical protein
MEVSGQLHAPVALLPGKNPHIHPIVTFKYYVAWMVLGYMDQKVMKNIVHEKVCNIFQRDII